MALPEVVVLSAVILVMLGLLLPVAGQIRHDAQVMTCMGNISDIGHAMEGYLADHQGRYPGRVYDGDGDGVGYAIRWHNLLGPKGTTIWPLGKDASGKTPAADRPLNPYLADYARTSCCPLDKGGRERADRMCVLQGSSYFYFDRPTSSFERYPDRRIGRMGVWAVEGHLFEEIEDPSKKLITADTVIVTDYKIEKSDNRWHSQEDPMMVSVLFADGHGKQVARKMGEQAMPEKASVLRNEWIDKWRLETEYY